MTPTAYAAPHIRFVGLDSAVIILDLATGEYLSLQPPASQLWLALVGGGEPAADEPVRQFRQEMIARGYLLPEPPPPADRPASASRARRATVANALMSILRIDYHIGRRRFPEIYRSLQRPPVHGGPPSGGVDRALKSFLTAEGVLAYRKQKDDCLRRSLALFHFCSGCGLKVRHVIGVRANPFQAHAWVSSNGVALLDSPTKVDGFAPIATM